MHLFQPFAKEDPLDIVGTPYLVCGYTKFLVKILARKGLLMGLHFTFMFSSFWGGVWRSSNEEPQKRLRRTHIAYSMHRPSLE